MSWFGDIFKHMDLNLCLGGGSGQSIDVSASSGSRFGWNQAAMCNPFVNRGCDVRVDQNCYGRGSGYGYGSGYGGNYGDEIRQAAALHQQEVALTHDAAARSFLGGYGGYSGYGGDGCFGRQRGGLSADFNIGANSMRCDPGGRLGMTGGFNYENPVGRIQPNINFSLRNFRL
jgi:hypothetical protein